MHLSTFWTERLGLHPLMPRCLYRQPSRILRLFGVLSVFVSVLSSIGLAQGTPTAIKVDELPNAPGRGSINRSQDSSTPASYATLSGVVADIHGAAVPGSRVALIGESEKGTRVA
jgi:hypothetical protein